MTARYSFVVLQHGDIRDHPGGRQTPDAEHRCTSLLIRPAGERPCRDNTLLTDPCFYTRKGYGDALAALSNLAIGFADIGRYYLTHQHGDHQLRFASPAAEIVIRRVLPDTADVPVGMDIVPVPGHTDRGIAALVFQSPDHGTVWVPGDAILSEAWLRSWEVYAPQAYSPDHVRQQWHSVATIVSDADLIVPGHGEPVAVDAGLLEDLVAGFTKAPYAEDCPAVADSLRRRLETLRGDAGPS